MTNKYSNKFDKNQIVKIILKREEKEQMGQIDNRAR